MRWCLTELPCFDCRVWNCPTKEEAANAVLWREQDATKNSISMAARKFYQPKDLFNKKAGEMQNMLFEKGINWNDYPNFFKRGTFIQKKKKRKKFTVEELEKLPKKHVARENPQLEIERTEIKTIEMPPFAKVTNRVGVIFGNETPLLKK